MTDRESFIKARAAEAKLNLSELATELKVSRATLYAWMNGTTPGGDKLLALADALKLDDDNRLTLYRLLGEPPPSVREVAS